MVAIRCDALLIDAHEAFAAARGAGEHDGLMNDAIHPGAAGHLLLAKVAADALGLRAPATLASRHPDHPQKVTAPLAPRNVASGSGLSPELVVLTQTVVDVGEASGVELELSSSPARSHGGLSCPTLMPGSLQLVG